MAVEIPGRFRFEQGKATFISDDGLNVNFSAIDDKRELTLALQHMHRLAVKQEAACVGVEHETKPASIEDVIREAELHHQQVVKEAELRQEQLLKRIQSLGRGDDGRNEADGGSRTVQPTEGTAASQ